MHLYRHRRNVRCVIYIYACCQKETYDLVVKLLAWGTIWFYETGKISCGFLPRCFWGVLTSQCNLYIFLHTYIVICYSTSVFMSTYFWLLISVSVSMSQSIPLSRPPPHALSLCCIIFLLITFPQTGSNSNSEYNDLMLRNTGTFSLFCQFSMVCPSFLH